MATAYITDVDRINSKICLWPKQKSILHRIRNHLCSKRCDAMRCQMKKKVAGDGDCGGDAIGGEGRELAAKMLVSSNGKASTFLTSGVLWWRISVEKGSVGSGKLFAMGDLVAFYPRPWASAGGSENNLHEK